MFRPRGYPAAGMSLARTDKRDGRRRLRQRIMQISMIGADVMSPDVRPQATHVKAFPAQDWASGNLSLNAIGAGPECPEGRAPHPKENGMAGWMGTCTAC